MTIGRRAALSTCFLAAGLGIGTWGSNLPALGRRADLSEGEIGLVLLFFAAGAVIAMLRAPWIISTFGAGKSAVVAAVFFGFGIMSVSVPQGIVAAAFVAMLAGVCFGTLDVTMNNEAVTQERAAARPIMSSFHALFSIGTLVSSATYAGFVRGGLSETSCLVLAGTAVVAMAILGWPTLRIVQTSPLPSSLPKRAEPIRLPSRRPVFLLGGMAFLAFFAEGAILDWIAVFVVRVVGSTESAGALSYAVFASAMTLGRFGGDRAKRIIGGVQLFRFSALFVVAGFTLTLAMPLYPSIMIGMVLSGIGAANLVPLIFSAAGQLRIGDGGKAMSQVMTMGYAGILIGPAIIGFAAELLSLKLSLWIVVMALLVLAAGGRLLKTA